METLKERTDEEVWTLELIEKQWWWGYNFDIWMNWKIIDDAKTLKWWISKFEKLEKKHFKNQ